MTETNGVSPTGLEQYLLNTEKKTPSNELGQSEFLKLMMTQIKHQDPLNPTEGGEFLSQLAQFGTVNGITELQSSFSSLSGALQSNMALQASTMVGRSVLIDGNQFVYSDGEAAHAAVDVPVSTSELIVSIHDSAGQLVRQMNLGIQSSGITKFSWDGNNEAGDPLPSGAYFVQARANIDGEMVAQDTLVQAKVESVSLGQGTNGAQLNLYGLNSIAFDQVKEIL